MCKFIIREKLTQTKRPRKAPLEKEQMESERGEREGWKREGPGPQGQKDRKHQVGKEARVSGVAEAEDAGEKRAQRDRKNWES